MGFFGNLLYGLQVAAIGLVVVFLGLGILIGLLYAMAAIFKKIAERKEAKAQLEAPKIVAPAPQPEAVAPQADEEVEDPELIAVIAAAIAAFDKTGKGLVVRKVRRVSGWDRAARTEQVARF